MVNSRQINKGQVDTYVKCLKLVLVYIVFYKSDPQAARNKVFRIYVDSKVMTLKVELRFSYKKTFRLKSLNTHFFSKNNFTRTQVPAFLMYFLYYFYPGIFMFGMYSVGSSLLEKLIQKTNHQLVSQPMFSRHKYRKLKF